MNEGHGHGRGFGRRHRGGRFSRLGEPALLYLLGAGKATHGYELMERANALGLSETAFDPGIIYRTLRAMESEGLVASGWDTAGAGPARRDYELTELGWERLAEWTAFLERRAQALGDFATACRAVLGSVGYAEPGQAPTAVADE